MWPSTFCTVLATLLFFCWTLAVRQGWYDMDFAECCCLYSQQSFGSWRPSEVTELRQDPVIGKVLGVGRIGKVEGREGSAFRALGPGLALAVRREYHSDLASFDLGFTRIKLDTPCL
ncbi:unnamed protein product [Prunus armeniaca]